MELIIPPRKTDLGDGFTVNRVLPYVKKRLIGPFIFWDHMGPFLLKNGDEMVVRAHPHIGLATLTYLFSGQIFHQDSLGVKQPIRPGEVNWMIAGSGIVHSERTGPISENKGAILHGIQLWIALPKSHEDTAPAFHHFSQAEIPEFTVGQAKIRLIAGEAFGQKSPVPIHSPLFYLEVHIPKGGTFSYRFPGQEGGLYCLQGSASSNGQTVNPLEMGVFREEMQIDAKEDSHWMILGGAPLPEGRNIFWNFVHSEKEKIQQAKQRWWDQSFPKVPGESDFVPLARDESF